MHTQKKQIQEKATNTSTLWEKQSREKKSCKPEDKHMSAAAVSLNDSLKIW